MLASELGITVPLELHNAVEDAALTLEVALTAIAGQEQIDMSKPSPFPINCNILLVAFDTEFHVVPERPTELGFTILDMADCINLPVQEWRTKFKVSSTCFSGSLS